MDVLHQPGDIIAERYCITGTLGQDGVGITYQAQDLNSGQQVVLKVLSLRQMGEWKALELFDREAQILSQLNHPAIPQYLDYFEVDTPEDRAFYLVQQLVEGKSLADLVKDGWYPNESEVRHVAEQVLSILVYLHELQPPVVHRNIKPQNLIQSNDRNIFLVNFESVTDTDGSTFTKRSSTVGTDGYTAPEQFRGQGVPATDLYSLGATVLFLLTHRAPANLPQEKLKINFRSRIQVSKEFANWLEKMLQPDVEHRFPSAKEALEALQGRVVVAKTRPSVPWKALVGAGVAGIVSVSVFNSFKWTILGSLGVRPSQICEATESGNLNIVRDYLKQGGDPYAKDESDRFLLLCLLNVKNGTKDLAKLVVAKLPDVNARDNEGKTLLHLTRWTEMAEALIAAGADVNAQDKQGVTPLHLAKNQDIAELLIAKGADVNVKDKQGDTPLDRAFGLIHSSSPPQQFPPQEQLDLAKLLIAKGARFTKVNTKDKQGQTLLHKTNSKQVAELLIAAGADVDAKDNQGVTPLHLVTSKDIAKLLIDKGADVNAKTNDDDTPLNWVGYRASCDVVKLLKKHGATTFSPGGEGWTILCPSEEAYGFKFTEDGTLSYQGKEFLSSSNPLTYEWGTSIEIDRLIISNPSSSGNFNVFKGCNKSLEDGTPKDCSHLFFIDKKKGELKITSAGKYGADSWVEWSSDERYAILAGSGCGVEWFYAIDLQTGDSRSFKKEFNPGTIELSSFSWINHREFKVKIVPHPQYPGSQKDTASSFLWRGNIEDLY